MGFGHGWQQNDWGGEFGSASDLDQAAPRNPVYLTAKSLHAGWANSAALKLAGITVNTPDPQNGKILRDDSRTADRNPARIGHVAARIRHAAAHPG
jgi:predicted amidohydrolase YtcJ